jgi:hypothetical protein
MIELGFFEKIAPGISNITPEELETMQKFTLLWTLFEAQVLENNASVQKIVEKVEGIDPEIIKDCWCDDHLSYFSNRYFQGNEANYHFGQLHLRKNDNPDLVRSVLTRQCEDPDCKLIVCLTIVYRFRNNFFHGIKWAYGFKDQLDNFKYSIDLLMKYLERVPNVN